MSIYVQIVDHVNQEKKYAMTGQMTLFDMVGEEEKEQFEIKLPDVGEYSKENLLAFEKEVLGVYLSGHPLQEYETNGENPFQPPHWISSRMKRQAGQRCMTERGRS